MQKALEAVHIDPTLLSYIVEIVQRTREDLGSSTVHHHVLVKVYSSQDVPVQLLMVEIMLFPMISKTSPCKLSATEL